MENFNLYDAQTQFIKAIQLVGLDPPDFVEAGRLYRFPGIDKRNGNTAGWCKLFADAQGGVFGDWSRNFTQNWQAKREKPFSRAERATFMRHVKETRKRAEAERKQQHADVVSSQPAGPGLDLYRRNINGEHLPPVGELQPATRQGRGRGPSLGDCL